jgi:hypothetical protein
MFLAHGSGLSKLILPSEAVFRRLSAELLITIFVSPESSCWSYEDTLCKIVLVSVDQ